jgi:hypothetical protein
VKFWHYWMGGSIWAGWPAFLNFFREVCDLDLGEDLNGRLEAYVAVTESAGYWWPNKDFVMVSERPIRLQRDDQGRLHSTDGYALQYPDGWGLCVSHGVTVPTDIILNPESISAERINKEANAEVRRVMMDRFGWERYLRESNAKQVQRDACGILWRKEVPDDEALVMVEVLNSTPEPDGQLTRDEAAARFAPDTPVCHDGMMIPLSQAPKNLRFKGYMLRVPESMHRARQAVAWTFNMAEEEYEPAMQS